MKILTTSDLAYVSGGADGESSQRGGGWYDDGESCHAGVSPEQQAASEAFANGMSLIVTNPEAAAASYLIQFYNM